MFDSHGLKFKTISSTQAFKIQDMLLVVCMYLEKTLILKTEVNLGLINYHPGIVGIVCGTVMYVFCPNIHFARPLNNTQQLMSYCPSRLVQN